MCFKVFQHQAAPHFRNYLLSKKLSIFADTKLTQKPRNVPKFAEKHTLRQNHHFTPAWIVLTEGEKKVWTVRSLGIDSYIKREREKKKKKVKN